jgi:hypothetical protein
MNRASSNIDLNKLRSYSSVFSTKAFADLIQYNDYSFLDAKLERFDKSKIGKTFATYYDYIRYIYRELRKNYRNEYIYKNTFIKDVLIKQYALKDTIAINEFKVNSSIADIVLFNGLSKAFEIKTELDSKYRLSGQLSDYKKIFNESYIITHESLVSKYLNEDENVGIIQMVQNPRSVILEEVRHAKYNENIDASVLMKTLRTAEYKNIVKSVLGELPQMNSFNMYDICYDIIKDVSAKELNPLFLNEIKKRKSSTSIINSFNMELRHLCLAMNMDDNKYQILMNKLCKTINL